jgi:hypothetical protein
VAIDRHHLDPGGTLPRSPHRHQVTRLPAIVAPIAPFVMAFVGVATGLTGLSHLIFSDNTTHDTRIILSLLGCAVTSSVLAGAVTATARRQMVDLTGILGVIFVGEFSSAVCLVAWISDQGVAQSLPYCVITSLGATLFWPRVRYFVLGLAAAMSPPLVMMIFATHKTSTMLLAIQLMAYGNLATIAFYLLIRHSPFRISGSGPHRSTSHRRPARDPEPKRRDTSKSERSGRSTATTHEKDSG